MKMFFMVLASLCLTRAGHAQNINTLEVGDRLPDLTFTNVINAPYSSIPYAELKDKVVVLDFFATWCSSCLNLFPHLDSLQAKFGNKLAIFVVTKEPREKVENMLKTKAIAKGLKLPFIVEDSLLNGLFPHRFIPHEVILKGAEVAAITFPEFLSDRTIGKLLTGQTIELPAKKDIQYDFKKSIYSNNVGSPKDLSIWKFLLTKHIDGLASVGGKSISSDSSRLRVAMVNRVLLYFILSAADMLGNANRVILHVRDSTNFLKLGKSDYEWRKGNTYGMEYVIPSVWKWKEINGWLLQQLNLCLGYKIYKKELLTNCWVLSRMNDFDNSVSKVKMHNVIKPRTYKNILSLINSLNNQVLGKPFVPIIIDEVNDPTITDIKLYVDNIHDPEAVSIALRPYGLILKPAKRNLEMLIIADKESNKSVDQN